MQKLKLLFSIIVIISLTFISCQESGDITSPADQLNKGWAWGTPPIPINTIPGEAQTVDIVAGQNEVCGQLSIQVSGSDLIISYNINSDWTLVVTHLEVKSSPTLFYVNGSGNPVPGQFEFTGETTYTIPLAGRTNTDGITYIAAHAVVENCEGLDPTTAIICPNFEPDVMTPYFVPYDNQNYTMKVILANQGTYYGFCFDNSRYLNEAIPRNVDFICSYDPNFPSCTTFVEKPENLDLINWIINNRQPNWDKKTLQAVIWELISPSGTLMNWQGSTLTSGPWRHDPVLREEIIALAMANGEGFVPSCEQKVIIFAWGTQYGDICNPWAQVVGFEVSVECETICNDQTAWAFNYPIPTPPDSKQFPGSNWARYFGYTAIAP